MHLLFEVNTKYISSSELKTSKFSQVRSTGENLDVFKSRDEIYLSRRIGKPTICIGENKGTYQLNTVAAKLTSAFVFATWIVLFLFFLNPKFQASSHPLWLHKLVRVGPGRNPNCWFSYAQAHLVFTDKK